MPQISLIATVYNDVEGVRLFLTRMEEQTRRPDEIVICDAGSKDGTWELLQEYQRSGPISLVALRELKCRPARGRNLAGKVARHDILAVTDIGCDWDREWFKDLVQPFETIPGLEVDLGSWTVRWAEQQTPWAKADYVLQGGLELRAVQTSHSANRSIAYRKDFYFGLGGLPEDLSFAADDMVLALLIQKAARSKSADPKPSCYWSRPQTLKSLLKESRRNSRGDGEADIHRAHTVLTLGRFGLEVLVLLTGLTAALTVHSAALAAIAALTGIAPTGLRIRRLWHRQREYAQNGAAAPLFNLVVLDYGRKMWSWLGYLEGWRQGLKNCRQCRTQLRLYGVPPW
jgi:hypothetical protein